MTRYAQNGGLTRFDTGGTHEESPISGIPIGNNNSVEENETKNGNFIYSNRIFLDENTISQYNLPKSLIGKSVADASKFIDNKFKGRNDKISQSTKDSMLSKVAEAQESMKPQEPEMEQDYSEENIDPSQMAYGGMQRKYNDGGYIQGDANLDGKIDASDVPGEEGMTGSQITAGVVGGLGTGLQLGQTAFGKATQDTSGVAASERVGAAGMIGGSAIKGATAGAAFGPLGAGIGAAVGGLAGLVGLGKARKAEALNTQRFALNTNRGLSDNYAAYGGNLNTNKYANGGLTSNDRVSDSKPYPSVSPKDFAGKNRSYPIPTKADAIDALRLAGLHGRSDIRSKVYQEYPSLKHANGGLIDPKKPIAVTKQNLGASIGNTTGMSLTPNNQNLNFNTKKIVRYQPGVTNDKMGQGFYLYSKNAGEPGFDVNRDREFVKQSEMGAVQRTPQWQNYMKSQSIQPKQMANGGNLIAGQINPKTGKRIPIGSVGTINPITDLVNTGITRNASPFDINNTNVITPLSTLDSKSNLNIQTPYQQTRSDKFKLGIMDTKDALNKGFVEFNDNAGNLARYAPIAANALQLAQLKKPQGERLDKLSNRYKPQYVDEATLQNIADQTMNNTISSISQSGASQGQNRASILGSQLQRTKALSDAYSQAASQNRAVNDRAQTFNLGVDQVNLNQSNTEKDINARDQAAYRNAKREYITGIGEGIGDIGKEQTQKKIIAKTLGYKWDGEYVKSSDGNIVTDPDTGKPMTGEKLKELQSTKDKKALGGYLIKNKNK